ncbi:autoinducer 2 ABC transporter substrate-binding protein [Acidimangrovimonas sediminis]|uniref:autoinducer 2 ABC transporter substrate-binding protein n=1 Tax=Acidimangrovimonas sediminis TaxID=2056283 RepID=UPI000C80AF48|nr:autoinducer 2 ABC transporter substrate-binding protein [Acidimangrovimonas sediminis]
MTRKITLAGAVSVPALALAVALAPGSASAKDYTIGFVPKLVGIPYFTAMKQGLEKAGKKFGAKIVYQGPTTASVSGQVEIAESLINKHLDAVGVSANSPTALSAVAKKAKAAGVLFYSSDSQVDGPDVSLRVSQADDKALAYAVIDQLAQQVGDKGDVAFVSGGPTATNLNVWIGFMKDRMKAKYPDMKLVSIQYAGEDISKATDVTSQLLSAYPNLKGVVGVNSTAVPGAAQAVLSAGMSGKVAVTGITDPNTIRPFVNNGTVKSVVLWNPVDLGYLTAWAVLQELDHKQLKAENDVPGLGKIAYDAKTKTLLLGKPLVITKKNIGLNF